MKLIIHRKKLEISEPPLRWKERNVWKKSIIVKANSNPEETLLSQSFEGKDTEVNKRRKILIVRDLKGELTKGDKLSSCLIVCSFNCNEKVIFVVCRKYTVTKTQAINTSKDP